MSLFRKNALEALNTPEQLDQPMQLLRPSYWTLILALSGFSLSLLIWSIFGRLPVRINGQGVLIRSESLQTIQSEKAGRIAALTVQVGDCIRTGDELARIESTQEDLERLKSASQLELLLRQDRREDLLESERLQEVQQEVDRVRGLSSTGAIALDDLAQREQKLTTARLELETRNNQRHQQIEDQRNQIKNIDRSILATSIVRAPKAGCVIDRHVKLGEVVQPGSTLFELEGSNSNQSLQSVAFFAPGDGKRLKLGQKVQITPSSTKVQRHGGIEGHIQQIRPLPVSEEGVISRLGNPAWLKAMNGQTEGPMIEVLTTMKLKASTFSGYDWGSGNGPNLTITSGTPTNVRVLVEERRPISYVIPLLRDLSGIY